MDKCRQGRRSKRRALPTFHTLVELGVGDTDGGPGEVESEMIRVGNGNHLMSNMNGRS